MRERRMFNQGFFTRLYIAADGSVERADPYGSLTLRVNGRLHHISIGRAHARTRVLMLVADLDVRIIHASTGELIRHLTIDPTRDYQPRGVPTGRPPKKP